MQEKKTQFFNTKFNRSTRKLFKQILTIFIECRATATSVWWDTLVTTMITARWWWWARTRWRRRAGWARTRSGRWATVWWTKLMRTMKITLNAMTIIRIAVYTKQQQNRCTHLCGYVQLKYEVIYLLIFTFRSSLKLSRVVSYLSCCDLWRYSETCLYLWISPKTVILTECDSP